MSKEIISLRNEKFYAETLIRLGGGSVKIEREISLLSLARLHEYIRGRRAERKYKYIYFEFKEYGIERIIQVILHRFSVRDVLIEKTASQFLEFCLSNKIIDIYDLLLIPYYSTKLVDHFGNEYIQAIINSIKTFIELQTLEYTNISFEDLE